MTEAWITALRFAALPGAARVVFERQYVVENDTPTTRYRLTSISANGRTIGDDRDYDLLKAAMSPLETLAEAMDHEDLKLEFDLDSGVLTGVPPALKS